MKEATNLIVAFFMSVAQFIIGVFLVVDKANLHTIGVYYIVSAVVMVLVALIAAVSKAVSK